MSTDRTINVRFFNKWGADLQNVVLKFSASKSGVESDTYKLDTLKNGDSAGPFVRHYQTGVGSENFDYWYVEFVSTGSPSGKFWCKNNFSCVLDSDVDNTREAHFWVGGTRKEAYTGFPESGGGWEGGYDGTPKSDPGSDYTCYVSLDGPG